jgi:RNA polymerase sigma factor (TIGR02999 family)
MILSLGLAQFRLETAQSWKAAMADETHSITVLLLQWRGGDKNAGDRIMELVYAELHRMASREMRRERREHTLQTTALVHEAYLRLCGAEPVQCMDRAHFFAVAAQQLRRVLVDHARRLRSERRGGGVAKVAFCDFDAGACGVDERLLAVDESLERLQALDPRAAKVVELRYFGGLTEVEAAEALQISIATLKRDWDFARSWLASELGA